MNQYNHLNKYSTVNTFTRKPCLHQILSYLIILLVNADFWILIQTKYKNQAIRLSIIGLYTIFLVLLIVFTFMSSFIDPSDKTMIQYRNGTSSIEHIPSLQKKASQNYLYCPHCKSFVKKASKHCKQCDRCVDNFDHHCIWINNCIGSQNYGSFMGMIIMSAMFILCYIVSVIALWAQGQWRQFMPQMVVNWIMLFFLVILFFLNTALIFLHLYLIRNNLTTLDYILSKKEVQVHHETSVTKTKQISLDIIQQKTIGNIDKNINQDHYEVNNTQSNIRPPAQSSLIRKIQQEYDTGKLQKIQFEQIDHKYLPKRKFQDESNANNEFQDEQYDFETFTALYKRKRSLKALIGSTIYTKSFKSSRLRRKKEEQSQLNFINKQSIN